MEELLKDPKFMAAALLLAAGVIAVALFGLRQLPWRVRVAASVLRLAAIVCVGMMLVGDSWRATDSTPEPVLVLDDSTPAVEAEAAMAAARGPDGRLRVVHVGQDGVREDGRKVAGGLSGFLISMAAGAEKPPAVTAYLPTEQVEAARAMLDAGRVPNAVHPLYPTDMGKASAPREVAGPSITAGPPVVTIDAPPVVVAGEPVIARADFVSTGESFSYGILLDGESIGAGGGGGAAHGSDRSGVRRMPLVESHESVDIGGPLDSPLRLPPGAHELVAILKINDKEVARCTRSIVAVIGEQVVVLTTDPQTVETYHALLPGFKVIGMAVGDAAAAAPASSEGTPDGRGTPPTAPAPWSFGTARAVILPLDRVRYPEASLLVALDAYVRDGGCVLVSGLHEEQMRERGLSDAVAGFIPVRFRPLPPLPPPPKPEDPPKETPKPDDKKPPEPKVKDAPSEAEVAKVSVCFVVDQSGSMQGQRWQHALMAVRSALENIKDYDRIGVVLFGEKPAWAVGGGMVDVTAETGKSVRAAIEDEKNGPQDCQYTDIFGAAEFALTALEKETAAVRLMVVISDGDEWAQRKIGTDHQALAARAIGSKIMIATIRVGAGGDAVQAKGPEEVMKALATGDNLRAAVEDREGETRVPKLSVAYVQLAYGRYKELQAEKQKEKDKADREKADAEKKAEAERKRLEEEKRREEEAKLAEEERKRRERERAAEEERKRREAEEAERKRREDALRVGSFLPGSVAVTVTAQGKDLLGREALPAAGRGLVGADRVAGATVLATVEGAESVGANGKVAAGKPAAFMVAQRRGLGQVLFLAAPIDAESAGSWLIDAEGTAALLDKLVRMCGRSRVAELSPVVGFEVQPGRVSARLSRVAGGSGAAGSAESKLRLVAVTGDGRDLELAGEMRGDVFSATVPPGAVTVELRSKGEKQETALARSSAMPVSIVTAAATPTAVMPLAAAKLVARVDKARAREFSGSAWPVMWLLLAMGLLVAERWVRRV